MPWLRDLLQELWHALLPMGGAKCDALGGTDTPHVQKPPCAEPFLCRTPLCACLAHPRNCTLG